MSLPRFRANAYTKCTRSYGIQSQTYARASYASRHQISEKHPVSGVLSSRNWGKGRYVNGYTHPNSSQNLILDGDRTERRRLRNGLILFWRDDYCQRKNTFQAVVKTFEFSDYPT